MNAKQPLTIERWMEGHCLFKLLDQRKTVEGLEAEEEVEVA